MRIFIRTGLLLLFALLQAKMNGQPASPPGIKYQIDLAGSWLFEMDPLDVGQTEHWYNRKLKETIVLPGSMATNNKGEEISVSTPWTGSIVDSSWYKNDEYAKYRSLGNVKVPFWLQPVKYYKGAAWYQKNITIPVSWKNRTVQLFIERPHWQTKVWLDGRELGSKNSLATPHIYDLTNQVTPGTHMITIMVDNRIHDINVGSNSHSISDHTQTNWNGMIGKICLSAGSPVFAEDVQVFPDIVNRNARVVVKVRSVSGTKEVATVNVQVTSRAGNKMRLPFLSKQVDVKDTSEITFIYPMGESPLLWDEFNPNLYSMKITVESNGNPSYQREILFGMRSFEKKGTQFAINDRITFLRGTLECAIFPLTGYPSTDIKSWIKIFKVCKSYGLNHMRFHSWCPPEVAFIAADSLGFYLQVEVDSWANQGATIGDGKPLDQYIYDESERITKWYGNHPSFCMMAYGNEPAGRNYIKYLTGFVEYWKQKDSRRAYTTGAGWPAIEQSDYNSIPDPRIQHWGEGLKSIINSQRPRTDYDWAKNIARFHQPTVSHEIGQWCVYPDFKEIKKYTGVLKAKNFEIFQEKLQSNGLARLADSFLLASGKLQTLCYKADIEAALRTPGFGGFQLLDLHDFPGQGTALVGVLNAFWGDKGYVTSKEYSMFCNSVVPLARFSKMIWLNNENLTVPVEVANFGNKILKNVNTGWRVTNKKDSVVGSGKFEVTEIGIGNGIKLGEIKMDLSKIRQAEELNVVINIGGYTNQWNIFVYPAVLPETNDILIKQELDAEALQTLKEGGSVMLTIKKGTLKEEWGGSIQIGFSSIFWNTAWTHSQAPTTMGILCNPSDPAFEYFPTEYYSNYQWWDAMSHSNAIKLDSIAQGLKPIVRVVDDWVTANSLGLIFECRIGKGKLLVSGIDLLSEEDSRPEARQLLFSLKKYMSGKNFKPERAIDIRNIEKMIK